MVILPTKTDIGGKNLSAESCVPQAIKIRLESLLTRGRSKLNQDSSWILPRIQTANPHRISSESDFRLTLTPPNDALTVHDYALSESDIRHVKHLLDTPIPASVSIGNSPITEGDFVFVPGGSSLLVANMRAYTGLHLKVDGIQTIYRICIHPDRKSIIVEYKGESDNQIHFSVLLIPSAMPVLFSRHEETRSGEWQWPVEHISLVSVFRYPTELQSPDVTVRLSADDVITRSLSSGVSLASLNASAMEIIRYSTQSLDRSQAYVIERLSISPNPCSIRSTILQPAAGPPQNFEILRVRGTQERYSSHAALIMIGETVGEGFYVLRTEKNDRMNWLHLSLPSSIDPTLKTAEVGIWGFDMTGGRLFLYLKDKLHVFYY